MSYSSSPRGRSRTSARFQVRFGRLGHAVPAFARARSVAQAREAIVPIERFAQATREIRDFERRMGVPRAVIVALTGLASAETQVDAMSAGFDFYLAKPVRFADLKRLMEV